MRARFAALFFVAGTAAAAQGGTSVAALMREADSLFTAGRYDSALVRYESILRRDSTVSRAVFQVAVLRSWNNELVLATKLHWRYVLLEPRDLEGRVAYARVLSWAGRFDAAIANFDTVLARETDYRDAALGRAVTLAWWGRFAAADSSYLVWLKAHPADTVALLDRARALSWAGRLDEALAIYAGVGSSSREASKGRARVLTWKGDLLGGEAAWEDLTRRFPDDPEVWVGLGQVRRWLGRPRAALAALDQALRVRPGYEDALQQRRWVEADLDPSVEVSVLLTHDSDHNDMRSMTAAGGQALGPTGRLTAAVVSRNATLNDAEASANTVRAAWRIQSPNGRLGVAFDFAITNFDARTTALLPKTSATLPSGGLRGTAQIGNHVAVGAGAHRSLFDEVVATMRSGVALDLYDADVLLRLPARVSVNAGANIGSVARGADGANDRWGASAEARWSVKRNVSVAVNTRAFGYERTATDGYFSPRRFQLTQLSAHWNRGRDLGWQCSADAGGGRQTLRLRDDSEVASRFAWNASAAFGFRWRPGVEWYTSGIFANVASPSATISDAEYRYSAVTAGLRWLY